MKSIRILHFPNGDYALRGEKDTIESVLRLAKAAQSMMTSCSDNTPDLPVDIATARSGVEEVSE